MHFASSFKPEIKYIRTLTSLTECVGKLAFKHIQKQKFLQNLQVDRGKVPVERKQYFLAKNH